tara:strand:- start:1053 stop:1259 length:207 start_codon:yes stop_codon:yes gene_type:complete
MSNNEIKLTVNVSDDLIEKVVGAMIKMNSMQSMGALPMMLGGMLAPPSDEKKAVEDRSPMGFRSGKEQ